MSIVITNTTPLVGRSIFERSRKTIGRLAALIFLLALVFTESPTTEFGALAVETVGLLLVFLAALGRVWCSIYIAGRKNAELCTEGPYSLCRHPLYLCSFAGLVGIALAARLFSLGVLAGAAFWLYHHFVISTEEKRLGHLFGEEHSTYRAKVPRLWPKWNGYVSRDQVVLNPRLIGRSIGEVVWFLVALIIVEHIEHLREDAVLPTFMAWPL